MHSAFFLLATAFAADDEPSRALPAFEAARRPRVEPYQQAALDSLRWFEEAGDYMQHEPLPFAVEALGDCYLRRIASCKEDSVRPASVTA